MTQQDLVQSVPKLYIVVREDLPPGAQACQAMHAMREFVQEYPMEEFEWYDKSNTIAFLAVRDSLELAKYMRYARDFDIKHVSFREPDFDYELTAVAFEPKVEEFGFLRKLPLALRKRGIFR